MAEGLDTGVLEDSYEAGRDMSARDSSGRDGLGQRGIGQ